MIDWEIAAQEGRLEDGIVNFIDDVGGGVTLPQLQKQLRPYADVEGTFAIEILPNGVAWEGLSDRLCSAISSLLKVKRIRFTATNKLVYLFDGATLRLPILKRAPNKNGLKHPHWCPVVMNLPLPPHPRIFTEDQ